MNSLDLFYDHLFCFHTNLLLMKPSTTYSFCKDNITFKIRVDTIKNIVTWGITFETLKHVNVCVYSNSWTHVV